MKKSNCENCCKLCRVEVDHLNVTADQDTLLKDVSFHIHCGQMTVLIGPNGAGKTTFIKALLNQIPHTGSIIHKDSQGLDLGAVRTGYVPQQLIFDKQMPATVCDLMASSLSRRPVWLGVKKSLKKQIEEALSAVHAHPLMNKPLGALSGGEMQRVLLAMALTPLPQLLILDEPVSGVDQNGLSMFLETVEQLKKTHHLAILLVSHDWDLVRRYADWVVLLDKTVLAEGPCQEVFSSPAFLKAFPGYVAQGDFKR